MLSKSDFMKYLECPCHLWLHKVRPDLLPPPDAGLELLFASGRRVDDEAHKLYEDGFTVEGMVFDGWENTQKALKAGHATLFQPTAIFNQLHARADILTANRSAGVWDIREVKMTTRVKEDHLFDLAFQAIVFRGAKIPIGRTYLVHLNNRYVRRGDIDPQALFKGEDVTDQVQAAERFVRDEIPLALAVTRWGRLPNRTNVDACTDLKKCEWLTCYLKELPPDVREYVEDLRYEAPLPNPPQIRIDKEAIRFALEDMEKPVQILDYETYSPAIPLFDGYRPYECVTFQYSLHTVDEKGKVTHAEYLENEMVDPAPRLARHLAQNARTDGSFVAWFATFEKGRNDEMAKRVPEYASFFADMNRRMYDPIKLFKKRGGAYYHSGFKGSASLKVVLPTLVPELSYGDLAIQKGDVASQSWMTLTDPAVPADKRATLRKEMLDYCARDTFGVVKILELLQKSVDTEA